MLDTWELAGTLGRWRQLGNCAASDESRSANLDSWNRFADAFKRDMDESSSRFSGLLSTSSSLLPGFGDPLDPSLGFDRHRWLSRDREEAYSDWLAWIILHQPDFAEVLVLFGLNAEIGAEARRIQPTVDREVRIAEGRLDILIRHPVSGTILIEVKTTSEPGDDQLQRYDRFLKCEPVQCGLVLLAPEDFPESHPIGCIFCSWERVSMHLRAWARQWIIRERFYVAAMTLSFAGAVERNLLKLGSSGPTVVRSAQYLQRWIKEAEGAKNAGTK